MEKIIIHCSATPNGKEYTAEDIHKWHLARNWSGIGYHYVIKVNGTPEKGRPEFWQGAHAKGHNKDSIGICLIGTDKFSLEQWVTLKFYIKYLLKKYPDVKVIGHNEVSNKTCPGFDVQEWMKDNFNIKIEG